MHKKTLQVFIEKAKDKILAVATDESVDRDGDKLEISKWDIANYKKNPVLQAGHNYMPQNTIGIAKNIVLDRQRKRLTFEPHFHEFTEVAKSIKQMFAQGILKTFSVGFLPKYKRDDSGMIVREDGYPIIDKYELLEISAVPVPANPNAEVVELAIKQADEVKKEELNQIKGWLKKTIDVPVHGASERLSVAESLLKYARETAGYYEERDTISAGSYDKIQKTVAELEPFFKAAENKAMGQGTNIKKVDKKLSALTELAAIEQNKKHHCDQIRLKALQQIAKNANKLIYDLKRQ